MLRNKSMFAKWMNLPVRTTSSASVALMRRVHMTEVPAMSPPSLVARKSRLTVCSDDGWAPRKSLVAMNEDYTPSPNSLVDETTGGWEVDEEVGIVNILHGDTHMGNARPWRFSRDSVRADR